MKTTPRNCCPQQHQFLRLCRRLSSAWAQKILIVVLALALPALAFSASVPTLFNTGVATNTSQGVPASLIPEGSVDPHYSIITSVIGAATPYTTVSGAYPLDGSRWVLNSATSRWISPRPNYFGGSLSDPEGSYTYRTMFDLSGFALGTVSISGQIAADNAITAIRINGFSIGYSQSGNNFSSFQAFALPSGHYLPGQNQIEFDVLNYAGSANPSGLRVEFTSVGVFSPALVARYQFNGDANDSSGNNLNGTATNSTFSGGLFGSALNTEGSLSSFVSDKHSSMHF